VSEKHSNLFENVFPSRSLFYEKIVQIECKTANLFARFAKMPPILCKDSHYALQRRRSRGAFRTVGVPPTLSGVNCRRDRSRGQDAACVVEI